MDRALELDGVEGELVFNSGVYGDLKLFGIHNPIFPHPTSLIEIVLLKLVPARCALRDDLDHPIRRTHNTLSVDFPGITDHQDIRLHDRKHIFMTEAFVGYLREIKTPLTRQSHVGGRAKHPLSPTAQLIPDLREQISQDGLMVQIGTGRHTNRPTVNQLPALSVVPLKVVRVGTTRIIPVN